jgi:hypothetical protein
MKNIDIKDGGPSLASDRKTEKLAETWKPKPIVEAVNEAKESIVKSKWFRKAATDSEKQNVLYGFDRAVDAVRDCIVGNQETKKRIDEWRERQG